MTRLKMGLVGLGMAVAPHAKSLIDLADRIDFAGAHSPSDDRRAGFAAKFGLPVCETLDDLLDDPSVEAMMVLTPPNTHLDLVRRCASAGKHILLEKPLEVSLARAEEMVSLCEKAGVTLGIVLQHRFRPAAERLAALLRSGDLGALLRCSTAIPLWRPQSYYDEPGRGVLARDGGGVLITQGIHTLDLMLSLAGQIEEISGHVVTSAIHRMETEDMVAAAVRYANGAIGTIDATTACYPGFPERIEMICRHGTAMLAGSSLEVYFHDGRRESVVPDQSAGGTGADPMAFPHDYHRAVLADFVSAVQERRAPRISGREALKVHHLIEALIAAGKNGGPVRVSL